MGLKARLRREGIQNQIETKQAMGFDRFLEEDAFLGKCNLGDLVVGKQDLLATGSQGSMGGNVNRNKRSIRGCRGDHTEREQI